GPTTASGSTSPRTRCGTCRPWTSITQPGRRTRAPGPSLGVLEPGSPGLEVAPLGKAGRPACGSPVARAGGCAVTRQLQEVSADRVEAVVPGDAGVVIKRGQEVEPGLRALHHRDRDSVVEGDHRIGRDAFEQFVEREDLRPVCLLRTRRLVVNRGDGRLQLIR